MLEERSGVQALAQKQLRQAVEQVQFGAQIVVAAVIHPDQARTRQQPPRQQGAMHGFRTRAEHRRQRRAGAPAREFTQWLEGGVQNGIEMEHGDQQQQLALQRGQTQGGGDSGGVAKGRTPVGMRLFRVQLVQLPSQGRGNRAAQGDAENRQQSPLAVLAQVALAPLLAHIEPGAQHPAAAGDGIVRAEIGQFIENRFNVAVALQITVLQALVQKLLEPEIVAVLTGSENARILPAPIWFPVITFCVASPIGHVLSSALSSNALPPRYAKTYCIRIFAPSVHPEPVEESFIAEKPGSTVRLQKSSNFFTTVHLSRGPFRCRPPTHCG